MKPLSPTLVVLMLSGCVAMPDASSIAGHYSSAPRQDVAMRFTGINDGRVHTPEVVYSLVLDRSGTFETSCRRMVDGMPMMDSSLHAGAYDPHEASHGSWELAGSLLVLKGDAGQYEASIGHFRGGWRIVWAGIEYHMTPDKPSKLFPSRRAG